MTTPILMSILAASPTAIGQSALLILCVAFFGVGLIFSLARLRRDAPALRLGAKVFYWWGVTAGVALLVWHSISRGSWLPLEDNFETFLWLALLLALFVLYVQRVHPLGGLDWFVVPIVIVLLIWAGLLGAEGTASYNLTDKWKLIHLTTSIAAAAAFAIAAAVGAMYLVANHRLRSGVAMPGPNLGSLERLEHLTMAAVRVGFALLSIALLTGLLPILQQQPTRLGKNWPASPKVLLACCVWVVYALVLHAPINPILRGRKAAWLSIIGFLLMIGTLIAVSFMPASPS